jgi:Rhs element Vgr protein
MVQYYSTDWDFMVARADANGQVVLVSDGSVSVKKPDTSGSAVLTVTYGESILTFEGEVDARTQYASVQATNWDPQSQANVQASSQSPGLTPPGNLSSSTLSGVIGLSNFQLQTPATWQEASIQSWANAIQVRSALSMNTGRVTFQGNATALPGAMLELAGLGTRFNGNVYITGVKQTVRGGDWITEVEYGIPAESYTETHPDITAPMASGMMPGIRGLQYAVVKQIQSDPDGQYRVLVNMPLVDPSGTGIWARLGSYYATGTAGNFFYPEVNDEVVLGFLNDDPSFAVILGSLYSSTNTPPYTPDEKNSIKAIVSKQLIKIQFDDENKVLTLVTPGNNTVILSDKDNSITLQDSNSNKIEMTSSGINITSASAVSIKAQTTVTIEGQTGISGTASGGDVKLSGLNVNAEAQMAMTAKGSLSAELSAAGQTTVKGAIVMIN